MNDFMFLQAIKAHTSIVEPCVIARCDVGHQGSR
jgi:hypothetical protein